MLIPILVLGFFLLLNGMFAMAELALMTSRQTRLQAASRAGNKGATVALALARDPTRFLSTVQVGITLIGVFAGAFGENYLADNLIPWVARVPAFEPYADTIALVLVVLALTYFSLVIGELVPKRIALAYPESIAATIARPLDALSVAAAWPVRLLSASTDAVLTVLRIKPRTGDDVSEDDVKALVARAASTGVFTPQEHKLIQRTMRVADLTVRDLMVSHQQIVWIDGRDSADDVRRTLIASPHTHFPVCDGDLDRISGVVPIKELISRGFFAGTNVDIKALARPALLVPESMPALKLIDQFQLARTHVAFVVDEFGGTQGLVTMDDVTAALVGESRGSPTQPHAGLQQRDDGAWLVDGRVPVHEFVAALGLPLESQDDLPDASTVGGLVSALLGRIPREAEFVRWQGWKLEVVDMDGARVDKLLVSPSS
ncbi:MAG: HlyC/CorC family transporter [Planctomycetes bacterium]|nr:HlyC/CorC family transporter [Planctomycetota bacterium]